MQSVSARQGHNAPPLPRLGKALDGIHQELLTGRGFVLIRGLPMERYSLEDAATAYWGIGRRGGILVLDTALNAPLEPV